MAGRSKVAWSERLTQSINKSRKVYGGNFVQLATVDADGRPKVRTVVFRGMYGQAVKFITNESSAKVAQVRSNPHGEMVWWFGKSREQYRVAGKLQVVDAAEQDEDLAKLRRAQWGELKDPAREQFYWPVPGTPVTPQLEDFQNNAGEIPEGGREPDQGDGAKRRVLPPPDTFVLLLLWPERCHYLDLSDNYAQIDTWDADKSEWTRTHVVP